MDESRMKGRGVEFSTREQAVLEGYKLIFNKKATAGNYSFANIQKDEDHIVEGVLYNVTAEGITKLDKYEGYPKNYDKIEIEVVADFKRIYAIAYIANEDKLVENLLPTKEYLNHILKGKDLLSDSYYQRLLNIKTVE